MAIASPPVLSVEGRLKSRRVSFREVALSDLRVDLRFQRQVDGRKVRTIKAAFHAHGLGTILVSDLAPEHQGEPPYAVIDGQTRLRVLLELLAEDEQAPDRGIMVPRTLHAEVIHGALPDECAMLFLLRNAQRAVGTADRQRVSVTEGDPVILDVIAQATACGHVAFSGNEEEMPTTMTTADIKVAIRIVQWGLKRERPTLLREALSIQVEAFGFGSGESLAGTIHPLILQATAELLIKKPDLVPSDLASVMRTHSDILFDAEKATRARGITTRSAIQVVLADRYNRLRKGADRIKV